MLPSSYSSNLAGLISLIHACFLIPKFLFIENESIQLYSLLILKLEINTLACAKIASGKLLCNTGSSAQCSVMTYMGGIGGVRSKREGIYV